MENKVIDFKKYQRVRLKVSKVQDNAFLNDHPHGYNVGHEETGTLHLENSNTYQCLFLLTSPTRYWHTSQVIEIEEYEGYDLVHTLNSTYKVVPQIVSIPGVQEKYSVGVANSN